MRALALIALLAASPTYATDCSLDVIFLTKEGTPLLKPVSHTVWINGRYVDQSSNWSHRIEGECGEYKIGVDIYNTYGASFEQTAHVRTQNSKIYIKLKD